MRKFLILLAVVTLVFSFNPVIASSEQDMTITSLSLSNPLLTDMDLKGVVVIDNIHQNDYSDSDMTIINTELENMGYIVDYTSDYDSCFRDTCYHDTSYYVTSRARQGLLI